MSARCVHLITRTQCCHCTPAQTHTSIPQPTFALQHWAHRIAHSCMRSSMQCVCSHERALCRLASIDELTVTTVPELLCEVPSEVIPDRFWAWLAVGLRTYMYALVAIARCTHHPEALRRCIRSSVAMRGCRKGAIRVVPQWGGGGGSWKGVCRRESGQHAVIWDFGHRTMTCNDSIFRYSSILCTNE